MVANSIGQQDEFLTELSLFLKKWISKGEEISIGSRIYGVKKPVIFIAIEGMKTVSTDNEHCILERV